MLRFEVPSREALDRLATGTLPPGIRGGAPERDFYRDVYFDTVGGDLERRGVTVCLRVHRDGSRVLTVDVRERAGDEGQTPRSHSAAEVGEGEMSEIFAGPSEPARTLRALVDPERLTVRLELETTRWRRQLAPADAPDATAEMACDLVSLRHGDVSAEFEEVEIRLPAPGSPLLDEMVQDLESALGLRVTLAGKFARARDVLEDLALHGLERAVRGARETTVVAHDDGKIALLREGEALRIPRGKGWGEESCRAVLRSVFGRSEGQVRLLGTSAGIGTRPGIEVWLAQRIARDDLREEAQRVVWLPLDDALALVGTPSVRDASTLAALHLAARQPLPSPTAPWSARARSREEHPFRLRALAVEPLPTELPDSVDEGGKVERSPELLINMELSELAFNERVLALAEDPRTPLLERVRFLSILGSNLDEFFMTRVAGFHQQVASGSTKRTLDGLTPEEQLDAIGVRARRLYAHAYGFLWDALVPELEEEGIRLATWDELEEGDRAYLTDNYATQLGAVLTPLAADPSHPFPHIRNLRPALGVIVRVPETQTEHFAAIELPGDLPRFVPLPGGRRFIPLEEVIAASLPTLYRGLEVVSAHTFRVARSANFSIDEEVTGDLLQAVQEKVQQRPLGPVVRLEVERSMPQRMRDLLLRELQFESRQRAAMLREEDVYPVNRLVDLFGLREIAALPLDEHHYPPLQRSSPLDPDRSVWTVLRERDVLVQFPYDSFEATVERMLADAARDERVLSIKITLYRTNRSSRVVKLLRKARKNGKEVTALVELKASFDEQRNIEWARSLESAGIHVVYGPAHLKVHAKILQVVRREKDGLCRYFYIGTGNLNAATAAAYTDLALLSTDREIGEELNDVFNSLTGYSVRADYEHLLVAPFNMRRRFLGLIEREASHARAGRGGHIRIKMNGLTDREIIGALYRASQAGARVELIIRGICSLRAGVPGLSENISVISVLGRFLEHSRIYRFGNAGEPEYFIGSADWRPRNLSRRVEVVAPIRSPEHRASLDEILRQDLENPDRWELQPDGSYVCHAAIDAPSQS